MITKLIIFTLIALISPHLFPGIKVKGVGAAFGVAIVFGILNVLIGWLVTLLIAVFSLPLIIVTLGCFAIFIPMILNAILLKITAEILDLYFRIDGWLPAFGMGFLFALGGLLAGRVG